MPVLAGSPEREVLVGSVPLDSAVMGTRVCQEGRTRKITLHSTSGLKCGKTYHLAAPSTGVSSARWCFAVAARGSIVWFEVLSVRERVRGLLLLTSWPICHDLLVLLCRLLAEKG